MVNWKTEWPFQCLVVRSITKTKYRNRGSPLFFIKDYSTVSWRFLFVLISRSQHSKYKMGPLHSISWALFPQQWNFWSMFYSLPSLHFLPPAICRNPKGSVIVSSQTNPFSKGEAPPTLFSSSDPLWWSGSWVLVPALAEGPCRRKSETMSSLVPASNTTRHCLWLWLRLWVMDSVKNHNKQANIKNSTDPSSHWNWSHGWNHELEPSVCQIPNAQRNRKPHFHCHPRCFGFPMTATSLWENGLFSLFY